MTSGHLALRNPVARIGASAVGGACIAALSALLLSSVSLLWIGLLLVAGVALIVSFVVSDALVYWLCLFLLTWPFDISKTFVTSDQALALEEQFGAPWLSSALNVHLMDLIIVPLLGLWLFRKIVRRERIWFPRLSYVPLAFLCFITVTAVAAPSPYVASLALVKLWKYFVIYVFAADTLDVRKLGKPFLAILMLTLVAQGTVTLMRYRLQYFDPVFGETFGKISEKILAQGDAEVDERKVSTDEPISLQRGFGTFYHANTTAMHLELLLPVAFALALSARSRRGRALYATAFAIGAGGLYVTFSRAGLMAFLVSTVVCVLVAAARGVIPVRVFVPLLGVGLLAGPLLLPRVTAYLETRPEFSTAHVEHLRHGMALFLSNPIFGVGLNNSGVARPFVVRQTLTAEESEVPIHSGYLLLLGETGVIGFSLCAGFFLLVGIEAFRWSRSADLYVRTFAVGTIGAYTAMAVHMTTDYLGTEAFHVMLWLFAGLIVALRRWEPHRDGSGAR